LWVSFALLEWGELMMVLRTNRIKAWVSLVPAASVIPARQVFFIIVVVKKFLAMNRFSFLLNCGLKNIKQLTFV